MTKMTTVKIEKLSKPSPKSTLDKSSRRYKLSAYHTWNWGIRTHDPWDGNQELVEPLISYQTRLKRKHSLNVLSNCQKQGNRLQFENLFLHLKVHVWYPRSFFWGRCLAAALVSLWLGLSATRVVGAWAAPRVQTESHSFGGHEVQIWGGWFLNIRGDRKKT